MAPKKKNKPRKKNSPPVLIDGVDTSEMNRHELEAFLLRVKEELDKERVERNYFQLERDKLRTFWEATRGRLSETIEELNNKDRELETTVFNSRLESHQMDQEKKFLQFEASKKIKTVQYEALAKQKDIEQSHFAHLIEALRENHDLRAEVQEIFGTFEERYIELKRLTFAEMHKVKLESENHIQDMVTAHCVEMEELKEEEQLIRRSLVFEAEERKNRELQALLKIHNEAFVDLKSYYNDITLNTLALITTLKNELETARKLKARSEKVAKVTLVENQRLKQPLQQATREIIELRRKLDHCEINRRTLARLEANNIKHERKIFLLQKEAAALELRNDTLKMERSTTRQRAQDAILEVQRKTNLQNVLYAYKMETMAEEAEFMARREELHKYYISLRKEELKDVQKLSESKIAEMLNEKNETIKQLRMDLLRISKAHDDLIRVYESKLLSFGLPKEELGFEPLRLTRDLPYTCKPAGLVTKNK